MKDSKIKVSVCVPIYKVEAYIEKCVVSLFEQSYPDIEYVFVNDCTTDKSMDILDDVSKRYPRRLDNIIIVNNKINKGISATRNTALENATGEYICWVDSDDYIETNMIEKMVVCAKETDADIVTCNAVAHFPDRDELRISPFYTDPYTMTISILEKRVRISVWGRLIRRSLYKNNKISFIDGLNNAEDFQVMPRLTYYAKKVSSVVDKLYHYNCCNTSSYTFRFSEKQFEEIWESALVNYNFFKDKGSDYLDAINVAKAGMISEALLDCVRSKNKSYFKKLVKEIPDIPQWCFYKLRFKFLLISRIREYRTLLIFLWLIRKKRRLSKCIIDSFAFSN